jgi:hypothetical protein
MDFTTLFLGLLFAALLYLHIKQSDLIFQHDFKVAKTLAIILLFILAPKYWVLLWHIDTLKSEFGPDGVFVFSLLYITINWILMITIFWKILSGCYKDAFFKRIGKSGQSLHEKIKDILLEVIETKKDTHAFKLFLKTRFEDPLLNSIAQSCKKICCTRTAEGGYSTEQLEKIKSLAEQLK